MSLKSYFYKKILGSKNDFESTSLDFISVKPSHFICKTMLIKEYFSQIINRILDSATGPFGKKTNMENLPYFFSSDIKRRPEKFIELGSNNFNDVIKSATFVMLI